MRHGTIRLMAFVVAAGMAGTTAAQGQVAWMDIDRTPPMGWNSWNKFACDVSEQTIKTIADAMVTRRA